MAQKIWPKKCGPKKMWRNKKFLRLFPVIGNSLPTIFLHNKMENFSVDIEWRLWFCILHAKSTCFNKNKEKIRFKLRNSAIVKKLTSKKAPWAVQKFRNQHFLSNLLTKSIRPKMPNQICFAKKLT